MKIFISIASYQDPLLETTILSAHDNASRPENLHFAICDQSRESVDTNQLNLQSKISYDIVDPLFSEGPCWARHRIQKFFENEDYYLQIDSHMQFDKHWDEYLISYFEKIKTETKNFCINPIITCYPRAFDVVNLDTHKFSLSDGDKGTHTIAYREDSLFIKDSFSRQIGAIATSEITHGYLMAAGCIFTAGSFVKDVPYDPEFYFYGEELSLMLRAFTRGYGIFHIPSVPIFHLYTELTKIKRALHWDPEEDTDRSIKWHEREERSIRKLTAIINKEIDGIYGLGTERDLLDYEALSGVDLINKRLVDRAKALTASYISELPWNKLPFQAK
jgi:hypothetical protein